MAEGPVQCELLSPANSLFHGKIQGICSISGAIRRSDRAKTLGAEPVLKRIPAARNREFNRPEQGSFCADQGNRAPIDRSAAEAKRGWMPCGLLTANTISDLPRLPPNLIVLPPTRALPSGSSRRGARASCSESGCDRTTPAECGAERCARASCRSWSRQRRSVEPSTRSTARRRASRPSRSDGKTDCAHAANTTARQLKNPKRRWYIEF